MQRPSATATGQMAQALAARLAILSGGHPDPATVPRRDRPGGSATEQDDDTPRARAQAATWYQRTFHGRADQVAQVRHEIAAHLDGCPAADDVVLIASELAANSIVHSDSAGEFFTVRCEAYPGYVWVEVEDLGGPWHREPPDDRPHGLNIVEALAGPGNWGTETTSDGDRVVWARLDLPPEGTQP